MSDAPLISVYEDRVGALVGVELLVLSLARHWPAAHVTVSVPSPPEPFRAWAARQPNVTLIVGEGLGAQGWDVKPQALLRRLDEHGGPVTWMDGDVILTGPPPAALTGRDPEVLVACEEFFWGQEQGNGHRASAWGLEPARVLATTVNTGVVAVGPGHREILSQWNDLLQDERYVAAQRRPVSERPLHLLGDQEVLTALLCGPDFAGVPLTLLRRGVDVAQCFGPSGFTVGERVRARRNGGMPPLVHAMGRKPWVRAPQAAGAAARARRAITELDRALGPYRTAARPYADQLSSPAPAWLVDVPRAARAMAAAFGNDPILQELPLAAAESAARAARRRLGVGRYPLA